MKRCINPNCQKGKLTIATEAQADGSLWCVCSCSCGAQLVLPSKHSEVALRLWNSIGAQLGLFCKNCDGALKEQDARFCERCAKEICIFCGCRQGQRWLCADCLEKEL